MEKQISAGCYIIRKIKNKYELLVLHRKLEENRDVYVIPKGHVERDEGLEQTAIREVKEETGYQNIRILTYLGSRSYTLEMLQNIVKTDHYYLAELINTDQLKGEEKFEVLWKDFYDAFGLLTWENEPGMLSKIKEFLKFD